jgi:3-hydroxyacyl-[acyl-carrier-protein] dehydratase
MKPLPMVLDHTGICEYQQNRDPYLWVDRAEEIIPGVSAKGFKELKPDTWFFKCHFPNDPNMPGLLQVEALVQLGALIILTLPGHKGMVAYLTKATDLVFKRTVVPGDKFAMEISLTSWKRGIGTFTGRGFVAGQLASSANFELVFPQVLAAYKVKT